MQDNLNIIWPLLYSILVFKAIAVDLQSCIIFSDRVNRLRAATSFWRKLHERNTVRLNPRVPRRMMASIFFYLWLLTVYRVKHSPLTSPTLFMFPSTYLISVNCLLGSNPSLLTLCTLTSVLIFSDTFLYTFPKVRTTERFFSWWSCRLFLRP